MSVWFITGSSRGFGLEIARAALTAGHQVVATARKAETVHEKLPGAGDQLLTVPLDVTDPKSIQVAVDAEVERFGRIDILVNNAGTGLLAAVEESDDTAVRAVYETNVFGPLAVQRTVLPLLRRQRSGHVINISSIVGFATAPGRACPAPPVSPPASRSCWSWCRQSTRVGFRTAGRRRSHHCRPCA